MEASTIEQLEQELRRAIAGRRPEAVAEALRAIPGEELYRVLMSLSDNGLSVTFALLGAEGAAKVFERMDAAQAAEVLHRFSLAQAADILEEMAPDDAADVVEELDPLTAEGILVEMHQEEAQDIRELMGYRPDSAGGIMTPAYVAVSPNLTAGEVLRAVQRLAEEAETVYYVYVVDEADRLQGVLSLRDIVLKPRKTPVTEIMNRDVARVRADDDQELAARLLSERRLLAIPVVDAEDRLLGIITADDVADVLQEEATEDIERLGGSQPLEVPYMHAGVAQLVRKRVGWLLLLFVAGAYTSNVLAHFEGTLSQVVELAFFIPLLIGTGGNVGSQIVTTLVRAMAVGELGFPDVLRVIRKELVVGLFLGGVMAAATLIRAATLHVSLDVGLAVAVAALFIVLWSALVASILPLTLRRLRADPAVVSAPLITTLVDGTGLIIYFTIANLLLDVT
ncbi:MAG TPA: magnesium transporter [Dehalococcoidia bacterium]